MLEKHLKYIDEAGEAFRLRLQEIFNAPTIAQARMLAGMILPSQSPTAPQKLMQGTLRNTKWSSSSPSTKSICVAFTTTVQRSSMPMAPTGQVP